MRDRVGELLNLLGKRTLAATLSADSVRRTSEKSQHQQSRAHDSAPAVMATSHSSTFVSVHSHVRSPDRDVPLPANAGHPAFLKRAPLAFGRWFPRAGC